MLDTRRGCAVKLIHNDNKTTTLVTADDLKVVKGLDANQAQTPLNKDIHEFRETAVYLDEIVLKSDLDWF